MVVKSISPIVRSSRQHRALDMMKTPCCVLADQGQVLKAKGFLKDRAKVQSQHLLRRRQSVVRQRPGQSQMKPKLRPDIGVPPAAQTVVLFSGQANGSAPGKFCVIQGRTEPIQSFDNLSGHCTKGGLFPDRGKRKELPDAGELQLAKRNRRQRLAKLPESQDKVGLASLRAQPKRGLERAVKPIFSGRRCDLVQWRGQFWQDHLRAGRSAGGIPAQPFRAERRQWAGPGGCIDCISREVCQSSLPVSTP